jgi:hypothetical protein
MICASYCARSAAVVGRQRAGREHTELPRTVGAERRSLRTRGRSSRRTASLALRALRRTSGVLLQFERLTLAKAEVLPPALHGGAQARAHVTSVVAEVLIVRTRALGEFRSKCI